MKSSAAVPPIKSGSSPTKNTLPGDEVGTRRHGQAAVTAAQFPSVAAGKFQALAKVAAVESGFRVPAVVGIDRASFSTTWIPNLSPAVELVRKPSQLAELSSLAGKTLAQIHAYLSPPTPAPHVGFFERWVPVAHRAAMQDTPCAFAHGDYGLTNLHLDDQGALVVLDPFPNGFNTDRVWSYESIYFDIASFVGGLASRAGKAELLRVAPKSRVAAGRRFIDAYQDESACTIDLVLLAQVCDWHDVRYSFGYVGGLNGSLRYQLSKLHRRVFFNRLANQS